MLCEQLPISMVTKNTYSLSQLGLDLVSAHCWKDHSFTSSQRQLAHRALAKGPPCHITPPRSSQRAHPLGTS